jgi:uncharacterized membrane protein YgcG
MKAEVTAGGVLAIAAVAVAGYAAWRVVKAAPDIGAKLNPFNPNNVAATAVNDMVSAAAGRPETLGGVWRAGTSNDDERIQAMLEGRPIPRESSIGANTMAGGWEDPARFFEGGSEWGGGATGSW